MRQLTPEDVGHLATGATFLACCIDPTTIYIYEEMIRTAMSTKPLTLLSIDDLAPDELIVSVGMVTQGMFAAELPPVGDEFLGCLRIIEAKLDRKVSAIFPLAAANMNGIVPLLLGIQSGLPVVDADPMGRVLPLISQTTLNLGGVGISPIAVMGVTGEQALVEANNAERAETLVRGLVTELGGWAATAMYPCTVQQMREHGVIGSITRMIEIGCILNTTDSAERKHAGLSELFGSRRVTRARVTELEGFSRTTDLGMPAQPSSVTLVDETIGRVIRLEIQNEILLVLFDGAVVAAVPDIVTMLDPRDGSVVNLDSLRLGSMIDLWIVLADDRWYTSEGLQLAGPRAFNIPIDHPRQK
jgi:DUF917 family protein